MNQKEKVTYSVQHTKIQLVCCQLQNKKTPKCSNPKTPLTQELHGGRIFL